ncbi:hypothetical protein A3D80_03480 [Candidatus Roizmanbacteria bacterium RIFCSPHIGHO2_02_FULL_40_13b]|uniref:Addiction module toxin RelE n=1 Tax=Candidatus Roizmanbacteria bacterium RIFCSPHIGHO2_01_FULL_39_24 TaxID=1802032 RepID=A0A1F7GJZ6_9BACT|nr:MAG: hypothetical protein A2799_04335 [Candidatus Roizmanbacteria bacterium RIFCSPHIGHO2_01_FULL_39_24]OGK27028.1 MAG: hypothetical protein A3D80_03480 [Candidatus Roizmanbacteria bacterium RIFCSPHIGHO2_02_FULL_40_13b]OGK48817.1 MAG: hypothetical protein A3A56_01245 [Candidatus Roizmanbacteria bacterium RIFCSPLOWO2_01_FULL_40_32]OGK57295.1 MAG: hypothetical protein A3H83_00145 [Candidatus Roizmanbacteria bacterium RIFCSPLOWO2_02_FULL_39_8]
MAYQVKLKPTVEKKLKKIPKKEYNRILSAFISLSINPLIGKKLEGEYKGSYSFRMWPYRIIYQIYQHQLLILVIKIGHRQGVYK